MVIEVTVYGSEGHRQLCNSPLSPSEIAKKTGLPPQRISEYRKGRSRPSGDARRALAAAKVVEIGAWECPPLAPVPPKASTPQPSSAGAKAIHGATSAQAPSTPKGTAALPLDVAAVDSATFAELTAYGLGGLECLIDRLQELGPTLPPRERVAAIGTEGRLHSAIEAIKAKQFDARKDWLESAELDEMVGLLSAALPGDSTDFRAALSRFGVKLPPLCAVEVHVDRPPPKTRRDVEGLISELIAANQWIRQGEPYLAYGKIAVLCLDVHATHIAAILADDSELAGRFLPLLGAADGLFISTALEKCMVLADVQKQPAQVRQLLKQCAEAFGCTELSSALEVA